LDELEYGVAMFREASLSSVYEDTHSSGVGEGVDHGVGEGEISVGCGVGDGVGDVSTSAQ
jgi:hypothetical protein